MFASAWMIATVLQNTTENQTAGITQVEQNEPYKYEMITPNANNIIIFNKQTGDYWRKYIEANEGPTYWVKQSPPEEILSAQ